MDLFYHRHLIFFYLKSWIVLSFFKRTMFYVLKADLFFNKKYQIISVIFIRKLILFEYLYFDISLLIIFEVQLLVK